MRRNENAACWLGIALLAIMVGSPVFAQENLSDWGSDRPSDPSDQASAPMDTQNVGGLTFYTDRATFDTDFPGLPCEDFEEGVIAPGGVQGIDAPLDNTTTNPPVFSAGDIEPGIRFQDNPGPDPGGLVVLGAGFGTNASIILLANTFNDTFEIEFTDGMTTAFGADLYDYFGSDPNTAIEVFDTGDVSLGTTTALADNDGEFWGVSAPVAIGRITITAFSDNATTGAEGVDDACFGMGPMDDDPNFDIEIPTLSQVGLLLLILALGITGILVMRR